MHSVHGLLFSLPQRSRREVHVKVVARQKVERTIPPSNGVQTFDIAEDSGTLADDRDYKVSFRFTGKIGKLSIALNRPKLTSEDEEKLMEVVERAAERR